MYAGYLLNILPVFSFSLWLVSPTICFAAFPSVLFWVGKGSHTHLFWLQVKNTIFRSSLPNRPGVNGTLFQGQWSQSSDNLKYKLEYYEKQTIGEKKPKLAKSWKKSMLKCVWVRGLRHLFWLHICNWKSFLPSECHFVNFTWWHGQVTFGAKLYC